MIAHGGLIAKHMLHAVGHEKTFGKPEPYQHVEHWTEQSRERCEQVGNGSGPESERHKDRRLVPGLYLTRARSHGTVRCSGFGTTWRDSGSHHSMATATSGSGSCRMTPSSGSHASSQGERRSARIVSA